MSDTFMSSQLYPAQYFSERLKEIEGRALPNAARWSRLDRDMAMLWLWAVAAQEPLPFALNHLQALDAVYRAAYQVVILHAEWTNAVSIQEKYDASFPYNDAWDALREAVDNVRAMLDKGYNGAE